MVAVGHEDHVKAINKTGATVDSAGVVFSPGQERIVSFSWMVNQYGDPRSVGDTPQIVRSTDGSSMLIQSRDAERLKVNRFWNIGPPPLRQWTEIPPLEFYTLDGERLYTVFDDPTGDHTAQAVTTVDEQQKMRSTIADQQRQIQRLLEITGLTNEAIPTDNLPQDDSTAPRTTSPWAHSEPLDPDTPGVAI